jgi:cell wall-associated NlpC family hydrolase
MIPLHVAARAYVGVPWVHKGRKGSELDCAGLAARAARDLGWNVFDLRDYPRRAPNVGQLEAQIELNLGPPVARGPVAIDLLMPDDIVSMRMSPKGRVRHVGIVGAHPQGGLSLIHTDSNIGRVVEQRIDADILSRIAGVYRRAV